MTTSKRAPRNTRSRSATVHAGAPSSPALSILDYYKQASRTDRFKTSERGDHYRELGFGFFGEVGGLLSALKKGKRDQLTPPQAQVVGEELGDALWYLVNMAALSGLDVEDLAKAGLQFLRQHFDEQPKTPPTGLTFKALDGIAAQHHLQLSRQRDAPLRMLAKDSGEIVVHDLRTVLAGKGFDRGQTFGRLLGELALVGATHGLRLELVAQENLKKIVDRWPGDNPRHVSLRTYGETQEQLPSTM
jgi:NTP pyrophosphatase (non-canonical NTP hydrolase)